MRMGIDLNSVVNNEEGLTSEEKIARLKIVEKMASLDRPLDKGELDIKDQVFKMLVEKDKIVLDPEGEKINFCYPVSGQETIHEVSLEDGRVFHSMCAIDSLGASFTFGQDLSIHSACSISGKEVIVEIKDGKISGTNADDIYAIHMDLNTSETWAASCWNHMNFFRGEENLEKYYKDNNLEGSAYALDLKDAFEVGKKIFSVEKTLDEYRETGLA